jgi:hypothetical protein
MTSWRDRLALGTGWAMAALGVAHVLATPQYEPGLDVHALWFASGGAALALIGWLNVLRVRRPETTSTLAPTVLVANLGAAGFATALVPLMQVSLRHEPQVLVAVGLSLAAALLALGRTPRTAGAHAPGAHVR